MAPSRHRWWAPGFPRCWLDLNQQIKSAKNIQYTVYLHCVAGRLVFCLDSHIFTFKPLLKPLDFPNCIFIPPVSLYGIFLGRYEQVSATPDRVPQKDQSIHQSPMWWVMSLFGLTDEHICEELLTGAETTPRKPHHQSPLQNRESSQKLETGSTLPNLKAAAQIGTSPFQVALLFQEACRAPSFSRQVNSSESISYLFLLFIHLSERRNLVYLASFRDFLKPWSCFLPVNQLLCSDYPLFW